MIEIVIERKTALAMVFKLLLSARRNWRRLNGLNHPAEVVQGVTLGGTAAMPEFTEIPPETVHRWIGDGEVVLVDVREADELAQGHLEEAVHVPMSAFDPELIPVDTGKKVVFICAQGVRSEQVGRYVVAQGILTEAYNLAGGLIAWAEAGLPLETGPLSSRASDRI